MAFRIHPHVRNSRPDASPSLRKRRIQLTGRTALAGVLAVLATASPQAARAADACGAPIDGVVNCPVDPGSYAGGIDYNVEPAEPFDLTVNLAEGATIETPVMAGLHVANLNGAATINADGTSIITHGEGATGIFGVTNVGDLTVHAGDVWTEGNQADGIVASTGGGAITISAGNVSTNGELAYGVAAVSKSGDVSASIDTISTRGDGAVGIGIVAGDGNVALDLGTVTTNGVGAEGINLLNYAGEGSTAVTVGTVATAGDQAKAIDVAAYGPVTINAGTVSTRGAGSVGIGALTIYGDLAVKAGTVTTTGDGAYGLFVHSAYGNVSAHADTVATRGDGAPGIIAYSNYGKTDLTAGTVTTSGSNAPGIFVGGGSGVTGSIDTVTTSGNYSTGVIIHSGNPYGYGDSSVTIGHVETHGYAAIGISDAAVGNANLQVGTVATHGDYAYGINSFTKSGSNTLIVDSVSTEGTHASAIYSGAYGGDFIAKVGDVSTKDDYSRGMFTESIGGKTDITITGDVRTGGSLAQGIFSTSVGGDTIIQNKGTITTTGTYSAGIRSNVLEGHAVIDGGTIVTRGDRSIGIDVFAVGNTKGIHVTADSVTTSGDSATGISLTNPDDGVIAFEDQPMRTPSAADGDADISLTSGAVRTAGADATAIQISGVGKVTVDATDTSSAKADAMIVNARELADITIRGTTSGGGNEAALISGADVHVSLTSDASIQGATNGLVVGAVGPYVPPQPGSGPVFFALDGTSGGTATIDNAGTISAPGFALIVEQGTARVTNSGTISGAIGFFDGDDLFTNKGLWASSTDSDFSDGADRLANSGTIAIGRGEKIAGNVRFLGLETLENSGIIDLRNGVAGDTLTLSGNYVGSGSARLGLDIGVSGIADKLVLAGAASGTTSVVLNASAANATLLAKPVTLVQSGTGTAATAFTIADQEIGFVSYGLAFNAASNSFQLLTAAGSAVHRLAKVNEGAQAIWRQSADAWSSHMAGLRDVGQPTSRVWGQAYGQVDTSHGHGGGYDLGYRQDYYGAQIGVDLGGNRSEDGNGMVFGITGGYLSSHLNVRAGPERVRFDTLNAGAYASLRAGPLFVNLLGQYDHYRTDADNSAEHWSDRFSGQAYGAQAEVGARFGSESLFAEPIATIAWQRTDLGTLQALGQSLDFGHDTGLTGTIGGRIGGMFDLKGGAKAVLYAKAAYLHEFRGKGGVLFVSGGTSEDVAGPGIGDYGKAAIGVNILSAGRVSGFIEGNGDIGGNLKGGGGRVGIRFKL